MVSSINSSTTVVGKRKKSSSDMVDSPPKRVTRARAKANDDVDTSIKTTKITTASARAAAAANRTPAKPAKVTKRKTRADDMDVNMIQETEVPHKTDVRPAKSRGRPKKNLESEPEQKPFASDFPPRTRSRLNKSIPNSSEDVAPAPKAKGRPKKVAVGASTNITQQLPAPQPSRGLVMVTSKTSSATLTSKPPVNRKTVTFKDNTGTDKENDHNSVKSMKTTTRSAPKAIGLKAKPIRKPNTTKTSTRGTKLAQRDEPIAELDGSSKVPMPLSPKKVKQIAKSNSTSSEDELCAEKTPTKGLDRSPVKPSTTSGKGGSMQMSNPAFTSITGSTSPSRKVSSPNKELSSSIFASPARRPPQSPFKDTLKESPRKFNITSTMTQPVLSASQSNLKTSLLQSPAKRPTSPIKFAALSSPGKSSAAVALTDATSALKQRSAFGIHASTPRRLIGSPSRKAQSIQRTARIESVSLTDHGTHTKGFEEEDDLEQHESESTISHISPSRSQVLNKSDENMEKSHSKMLQSPPTSPTDPDSPQIEMNKVRLTDKLVEEQDGSAISARAMKPPSNIEKSDLTELSLAPSYRDKQEESDSEDELQATSNLSQSSAKQPFKAWIRDISTTGTPTPSRSCKAPRGILKNSFTQGYPSLPEDMSMTPLATQLSSWLVSSPEKELSDTQRQRSQGIFALAGPSLMSQPDQKDAFLAIASPVKSTFFEDEMVVRAQEDAVLRQDESEGENGLNLDTSQDSEDSDHYSDENVMPIDPQILSSSTPFQIPSDTCTPARVFYQNPREVHTVSKVPLRAAAEESPAKMPRRRSRSLSGPTAFTGVPQGTSIGQERMVISHGTTKNSMTEFSTQDKRSPLGVRDVEDMRTDQPSTPMHVGLTDLVTPSRTLRKGSDAEILRGAVVYVDVHTTEGADASGIFIELLTQMGAKCVKQWTWQPRGSLSGSLENTTPNQGSSSDESAPTSRVGITHVVFKDGGKRTLEKVRESKGLVLCVGVGWVLE